MHKHRNVFPSEYQHEFTSKKLTKSRQYRPILDWENENDTKSKNIEKNAEELIKQLLLDRLKTAYDLDYNKKIAEKQSEEESDLENELIQYLKNLYYSPHTEIVTKLPYTTRRDKETRDFATILKKDYGPKRVSKLFKAKPFYPENLETNPITDAYKEYICTEKESEDSMHYMQIENLREYLNRVRNKHPHLKKFLPHDPPNETVIEREKKNLLKSTYQMEFSKKSEEKTESYKIVLPDDHVIPETIQRKSFMDPRQWGSANILKQLGPIKIPDNLRFDKKEREILQVRTGNTEYQDFISKIGRQIIKEQFFGPPMPLGPPEEHIKDPVSPRSVCSLVLMNASKKPLLSQVI